MFCRVRHFVAVGVLLQYVFYCSIGVLSVRHVDVILNILSLGVLLLHLFSCSATALHALKNPSIFAL